MKGGLTALATSMVLAAAGAVAQPAGLAAAASGATAPVTLKMPASPTTSKPSADAAPASQPESIKVPQKYSATDIARVFNFMDDNRDGHLSRQEAAGFKNVAKYFDAADTNQDGMLSLLEFGGALNRP